jgi:hypothetical protein
MTKTVVALHATRLGSNATVLYGDIQKPNPKSNVLWPFFLRLFTVKKHGHIDVQQAEIRQFTFSSR